MSGTLLAAGVGLSKTIGFDPIDAAGNLIGGGGEKGSGTTQRNTLAHAIDKLERANDIEAVDIAEKIKMRGAYSDRDAASIIGSSLGYSQSELLQSHKWDYIRRMLNQASQQANTAAQQQTTQQGTSQQQQVAAQQQQATAQPQTAQPSGGGKASALANPQNIVFGLVALILLYVVSQ